MRLTRQIKKHPLAECLFIRSSKRLRLHTTDVIITESSSERKFFFSCTIPTLFRSVPDLPLPAPSQGEKSEKGYINSETVIQLLNDTLRLNRKAEEHVVMLALNTALDIIGIFPISHGSLNESHCRGREIFQRAFLVGANGMILAHNHPSGHLEPSKEDLARKEELQQLGKLMGIYLHDFLIVSPTGAKSLMD